MFFSYKEGLSLDRINNDGDYCKENCRWATKTEQVRNTRATKRFEMNGEFRTIAEWCEIYNIPYLLVKDRIRYGWHIRDALFTEKQKRS